MQVALEKTNRLMTKGALHLTHAAVAEVQADITMAVVLLLSKLIKPTVNKRGNAALLGADRGVFGVHFQVRNSSAKHQSESSGRLIQRSLQAFRLLPAMVLAKLLGDIGLPL